jgi:hypothetical protein
MPLLMQTTASLQLRDAGFTGNPAQLSRMLRTIDPRDLDIDDDGDGFELVGMDDEIERLKEDFPQFFADADEELRPRRRASATTARGATSRTRGAKDVDGGNRGRQPAKPKGWAEQAVDQMMNRGR